jgi:hypothetical protein
MVAKSNAAARVSGATVDALAVTRERQKHADPEWVRRTGSGTIEGSPSESAAAGG